MVRPRLRRLILENIGPFDHLELELDRNWTVLLGDNGVGKSTVLRAIAAGLMGAQADPHAQRLLRSGALRGEIVLETSQDRYSTTLHRHAQGVQITTRIPAPVPEVEGWLALGFPVLRSAGWRTAGAPAIMRGRPAGADLLPLLTGEPDPRIHALRQWLVDLVYRRYLPDDRGDTRNYSLALDHFFAAMNHFTNEIRFHSIDPRTMDVLVETDGGVVPIEDISQGSGSLLGWIGVALSRLHEMYPDAGNPAEQFALILVDEIDAHLHPAWQQRLVLQLYHAFPMVQFVATTHSPLIVAALAPEDMRLLQRDEATRTIVVSTPQVRIEGFDAAQILTSDLFQLRDTRSVEILAIIDRYAALLGRMPRTAAEQDEFVKLGEELQQSLPEQGGGELERLIEQAVHKSILSLQQHEAGTTGSSERKSVSSSEIKRMVKRLLGGSTRG